MATDTAAERTTMAFGVGEPGGPPLVVSSYTLGTEVSYRDRVRAAAAAGFDGIGLRAENYWAAAEHGLDAAAMAEIAGESGISVLEVEYVTGWGTNTDRDEAQQRKERAVFDMARSFGVRHVNVGLLEQLPVEAITEAFAGAVRSCRRRPHRGPGIHALQRRSRPGDSVAGRARRRPGERRADRRRLALGTGGHDGGGSGRCAGRADRLRAAV